MCVYGLIVSQPNAPAQVCTQGGLCDQLQSKTELEDTQAQDRKAGIMRRKHLEEISDDEDTGKGTGCCEFFEGMLMRVQNLRRFRMFSQGLFTMKSMLFPYMS